MAKPTSPKTPSLKARSIVPDAKMLKQRFQENVRKEMLEDAIRRSALIGSTTSPRKKD